MKTSEKSKLKESNSLNLEKDNKQFPTSQFTKDQRKDAEKALGEGESAPLRDEEKESKSSKKSSPGPRK
jgi:hypothetical protein